MRTNRTVSLWYLMEHLQARELLDGYGSLAALSQAWMMTQNSGVRQQFKSDSFELYLSKIVKLEAALAALEAPISHEAAQDLLRIFRQSPVTSNGERVFESQTYGSALAAMVQLTHVLASELGQKLFVSLRGTNKELFDQDHGLFGEQVESVFPEAIGDISEAGKCLALERYTAAVFHMMRAMEAGVGRLAQEVGATVAKENGETLAWGILVSNIKAKIDKLPSGETQDKWLKLHALLHSANRAYRTKTAHPKDTYTEAEATSAFHATKSFMQEMADIISKTA